MKEALQILKSQGKHYENVQAILRSNNYQWVKVYKGNVIVKTDEYFCMYWNGQIEFSELLQAIGEKATVFFIVDENIKNALLEISKPVWVSKCKHYSLSSIDHLPENKMVFSELSINDVDYIFDVYGEIYDYEIDYVKVMVKQGTSLCIREDGILKAWAFLHDDGSLGGLYVPDQFRGKGYAKEISIAMFKKAFEINGSAYCDIAFGNFKSENLTMGFGFEYVRNNYWLEVEYHER